MRLVRPVRLVRRLPFVSVAAICVVFLAAVPAWAHTEFEPGEAGTGKVVSLELHVANEMSDAGTTQVELFFPEGVPITLAALPPVEGWTATPNGGAVGGPVASVTWSRPAASPDDDPVLPLTIGPMPADPTRLQFPTLQTYANGEIERWIEEWPAGAPEPDAPAPVLEVTVDGPGEVPAVTTAPSAPETTSTAASSTTSTTEGNLIAPSPEAGESEDDDSNTGLIVGIVVAVVVIAAAIAAYVIARRRRRTEPNRDI
jgi:uncharacterized protein YcnI